MTLAERCDEIVRLIDATLAEITAPDGSAKSVDHQVDHQYRHRAPCPAAYVDTADPRPGLGWLAEPPRPR